MELQRFIGKDTKSVMNEIRTTLGERALIVSNMRVGSKTEIIAACESESAEQGAYPEAAENSPGEEIQHERFSVAMADQSVSSPGLSNDDPWEHIRQINKEISSIKSALEENSAIGREYAYRDSALSTLSVLNAENEISHALEALNGARSGCFTVWGERKSGKTFVIRELIKRRAENHEDTIILRLPHNANADDSHLCQIAERFSLNVVFVNELSSIGSTISALANGKLVLIEADLSMLANFALELDTEVGWLQMSSHLIIDEDEEQTGLVSELFKQINAKVPEKIDSKIIEEIS